MLKGYKKTLLDKLLHRIGSPIYNWGYVTGTRRVVLDDFDGGFYGSNAFREQHSKVLKVSFIRAKPCTMKSLALRKTSSLLWHLATIKSR